MNRLLEDFFNWYRKEQIKKEKEGGTAISSKSLKQYYRNLCGLLNTILIKDYEIIFMAKKGTFSGLANTISNIMKTIRKKNVKTGKVDGRGKAPGFTAIEIYEQNKSLNLETPTPKTVKQGLLINIAVATISRGISEVNQCTRDMFKYEQIDGERILTFTSALDKNHNGDLSTS